jgi:hypothetical protein
VDSEKVNKSGFDLSNSLKRILNLENEIKNLLHYILKTININSSLDSHKRDCCTKLKDYTPKNFCLNESSDTINNEKWTIVERKRNKHNHSCPTVATKASKKKNKNKQKNILESPIEKIRGPLDEAIGTTSANQSQMQNESVASLFNQFGSTPSKPNNYTITTRNNYESIQNKPSKRVHNTSVENESESEQSDSESAKKVKISNPSDKNKLVKINMDEQSPVNTLTNENTQIPETAFELPKKRGPPPIPRADILQKRYKKMQPTIAITIPERNKMKSPELKMYLTTKLHAKVKERSLVNQRLYITPVDENDTLEILRLDTEFFPGIERRILNDKYLSVIAFNVSNVEINNDSDIQCALKQRGVIYWEPLQSDNPDKRSVKLFFSERDKTILFLKNFYADDMKCKNTKTEVVTIRIEPDIPSPKQCFKCYGLGHAMEGCSLLPRCGHCMSTAHETKECDCDSAIKLKCSICAVPGHSSLDRRCPKYRAARREAANLAVTQMTKISTNNGKKAVKDALHNHETTTNYAQAIASDQIYDDIKDRLKKLEREATHPDQNQMSKEISELRTNTQTFNKRINDIDANVKTTRREHETTMQALIAAIQSTKELGENFNKTTAQLEANMSQIAKQEVDILRKEHETIFTNQRIEYTGMFNSQDQRIARLESLVKYVSPNQPQAPLQSSIAHNSNAQHFNPNKQTIHPNYNIQASSTPTSTVVHEAHNVIYRNNTPAPMYSYPGPWNENAGATGQIQHFRQ